MKKYPKIKDLEATIARMREAIISNTAQAAPGGGYLLPQWAYDLLYSKSTVQEPENKN